MQVFCPSANGHLLNSRLAELAPRKMDEAVTLVWHYELVLFNVRRPSLYWHYGRSRLIPRGEDASEAAIAGLHIAHRAW